jgi:hypothetical protein
LRARLEVAALVVLLLVPTALAGHAHCGADASGPTCPACAARHMPTTAAIAVPIVQMVRVDWPLASCAAPIAPSRSHAIALTGRSPPPSLRSVL